MNKHNSVLLGVVVAIFFWASNFNAVQAMSPDISPFLAAGLRFGVAAILLLILRATREQKHNVTLSRKDLVCLFIIASVGVTVQNFSIFAAMRHTSPTNASIIMANVPLTGVLLSAMILKSNITRLNIVGSLISVVGVVLVITHGELSSVSFNLGDLLMVLALMSGCLYTILLKLWSQHIPLEQQLRWVMCLGTIQLFVIAAIEGDLAFDIARLTTKDTLLVIYMGLFGTLLSYYFWMKGAILLGPKKTTSLFNALPVFSLMISLFMGAKIFGIQLAGIAIVVLGFFVGNVSSSGQRKVVMKRA
ncbi:DMT family transporter [Vibrio coralliilyticus]|uniref:Transporter n=1 Tax=Vibrio coralliilyticus TaxID=190893 RepID=A0AAN0SGC5_9VIBR|nr:DMT family transporter [Vibrio coralliilyticus]AIW22094.1 transporter [Vibrio coralliilyticus]NOH37501.1 DMT family transporter [Vibrio coralliilyticus]